MPVAQRMTVAEYLEQVDDRRRTNLVDGEVVVTEALGLHQIVLRDLAFALELARGDTLTSPLLPGFALPLDELFGPRADATG